MHYRVVIVLPWQEKKVVSSSYHRAYIAPPGQKKNGGRQQCVASFAILAKICGLFGMNVLETGESI